MGWEQNVVGGWPLLKPRDLWFPIFLRIWKDFDLIWICRIFCFEMVSASLNSEMKKMFIKSYGAQIFNEHWSLVNQRVADVIKEFQRLQKENERSAVALEKGLGGENSFGF